MSPSFYWAGIKLGPSKILGQGRGVCMFGVRGGTSGQLGIIPPCCFASPQVCCFYSWTNCCKLSIEEKGADTNYRGGTKTWHFVIHALLALCKIKNVCPYVSSLYVDFPGHYHHYYKQCEKDCFLARARCGCCMQIGECQPAGGSLCKQ